MTSSSAFAEIGAGVEWPDAAAAATIDSHLPAGSGRLTDLVRWLAGVQGTAEPAAPHAPLALVLSEHPSTVAATIADRLGVSLTAVDLPSDAAAALAHGVRLADSAAEAGADLIVLGGGEDDTDAAAAVVCLIVGTEPVALLPRGAAAIDTRAWIARASTLRDTLRRVSPCREDPDRLLTELRSPHLALAAGVLMRSAARRTPVLLDGPIACAAAVLCVDVSARAGQWWRAADRHPDPVCARALDDLAHEPVLDLGLHRDDALAGLLAVGIVQTAATLVERTPAHATGLDR